MKQKTFLKFIAFVILIILVIFSYFYFDLKSQLNTENIRNIINSYGIFAPLVFILIFIIASVLFLPGSILSFTGGAIFGSIIGTIYTIIGATIGATLAFLFARHFTRSFFQESIERKYKKIKEFNNKLEKKGFFTVIFLRLIPIFPFNGLNLALGITKVKLKDYILGTFLGIIPGSFLYAYLGDSVVEMNLTNIIIAIVLLILLSLSLNIYKNHKMSNYKNNLASKWKHHIY